MKGWTFVNFFGLVSAVGGVLLLVVACRTCMPPAGSPQLPLTFGDLDGAYCELVDVRGRAQMSLRRNNDTSYRSETAFTNAYPDKCLGFPMHNQFAILADFSSQVSAPNPVPPLLSIPKELLRQSPDQLFPVFLLRPEENGINQEMHLVRIAFLTHAELDDFVGGDTFSYSTLQQKYQIQDEIEHPVWKLFSQDHLFEYLDAYKTR